MTEENEKDDGTKLSMEDITRSLTGYEENEIEERFGHPIGVLLQIALTKSGRALIFVVENRELGGKPDKAYHRAMSLTVGEVNDRFLDADEDEDDVDPDRPDTDQGKGDSPSE
jgi:hypothetical protein